MKKTAWKHENLGVQLKMTVEGQGDWKFTFSLAYYANTAEQIQLIFGSAATLQPRLCYGRRGLGPTKNKGYFPMTLIQASLPFHHTAGIINKHHNGESCWEHAVSYFMCASSPLFQRGCTSMFYHPRPHGTVFGHICLCVCLSVITNAPTFKRLDLEISVLVCRYSFWNIYIKFIRLGHNNKKVCQYIPFAGGLHLIER